MRFLLLNLPKSFLCGESFCEARMWQTLLTPPGKDTIFAAQHFPLKLTPHHPHPLLQLQKEIFHAASHVAGMFSVLCFCRASLKGGFSCWPLSKKQKTLQLQARHYLPKHPNATIRKTLNTRAPKMAKAEQRKLCMIIYVGRRAWEATVSCLRLRMRHPAGILEACAGMWRGLLAVITSAAPPTAAAAPASSSGFRCTNGPRLCNKNHRRQAHNFSASRAWRNNLGFAQSRSSYSKALVLTGRALKTFEEKNFHTTCRWPGTPRLLPWVPGTILLFINVAAVVFLNCPLALSWKHCLHDPPIYKSQYFWFSVVPKVVPPHALRTKSASSSALPRFSYQALW